MSTPSRLRGALSPDSVVLGRVGIVQVNGKARAGMVRHRDAEVIALELFPLPSLSRVTPKPVIPPPARKSMYQPRRDKKSKAGEQNIRYPEERETSMRGVFFGQTLIDSPSNQCVYVPPRHVRLLTFGRLSSAPPKVLDLIAVFLSGCTGLAGLAVTCGAITKPILRLGSASRAATVQQGAVAATAAPPSRGTRRPPAQPAPGDAWQQVASELSTATEADVSRLPPDDLDAVDPLLGIPLLGLAVMEKAPCEFVCALVRAGAAVVSTKTGRGFHALSLAAMHNDHLRLAAILDGISDDKQRTELLLTSTSRSETDCPVLAAIACRRRGLLREMLPRLRSVARRTVAMLLDHAERAGVGFSDPELVECWAPLLSELPASWWRSSSALSAAISFAASESHAAAFSLIASACPPQAFDTIGASGRTVLHAAASTGSPRAVHAVLRVAPHLALRNDDQGRVPLTAHLLSVRAWTEENREIGALLLGATQAAKPSTGHDQRILQGIVSAGLTVVGHCPVGREVVDAFLPAVIASGAASLEFLVHLATLAVSRGCLDIVLMLHRHRAEVLSFPCAEHNGLSPLGVAVALGNEEIGRALLDTGDATALDAARHNLRVTPLAVALRVPGGPLSREMVQAAFTSDAGAAVAAVAHAIRHGEADPAAVCRIVPPSAWNATDVCSAVANSRRWVSCDEAWAVVAPCLLPAAASDASLFDQLLATASWVNPRPVAEKRLSDIVDGVAGSGKRVLPARTHGMWRGAIYKLLHANGALDVAAEFQRWVKYATGSDVVEAVRAAAAAEPRISDASFIKTSVAAVLKLLYEGELTHAFAVVSLMCKRSEEEAAKPAVWPRPSRRLRICRRLPGAGKYTPDEVQAWRVLESMSAGAPVYAAMRMLRDVRISSSTCAAFVKAVTPSSSRFDFNAKIAFACVTASTDRRAVLKSLAPVSQPSDCPGIIRQVASLLDALYPDLMRDVFEGPLGDVTLCGGSYRGRPMNVDTRVLRFRVHGDVPQSTADAPLAIPGTILMRQPWTFGFFNEDFNAGRMQLISVVDPPRYDDDAKWLSFLETSDLSDHRARGGMQLAGAGLPRSAQLASRGNLSSLQALARASNIETGPLIDTIVESVQLSPAQAAAFTAAVLSREDVDRDTVNRVASSIVTPATSEAVICRCALTGAVSDARLGQLVQATRFPLDAPSVASVVIRSFAAGQRHALLQCCWSVASPADKARALALVAASPRSAQLTKELAPSVDLLSESALQVALLAAVRSGAPTAFDAIVNAAASPVRALQLAALLACQSGAWSPALAAHCQGHVLWADAVALPKLPDPTEHGQSMSCMSAVPQDAPFGDVLRHATTTITVLTSITSMSLRRAEQDSFLVLSLNLRNRLRDHLIDSLSNGRSPSPAVAEFLAVASSHYSSQLAREVAPRLSRDEPAAAFGSWLCSALPSEQSFIDTVRALLKSPKESAGTLVPMLDKAHAAGWLEDELMKEVVRVAVGLNVPEVLAWMASNHVTAAAALSSQDDAAQLFVAPSMHDAVRNNALGGVSANVVPYKAPRNCFSPERRVALDAVATEEEIASRLAHPRSKVPIAVDSNGNPILVREALMLSLPPKLDALLDLEPKNLKRVQIQVSPGAPSVAYRLDDGQVLTVTFPTSSSELPRYGSAFDPDLPAELLRT